MQTAVVKKVSFHAAHRLNNSSWSAEKNQEVFGLCNNPNYHGHNYDLHFKVSGAIDADTGYVIDLKVLGDLLQQEIVDRFDHRNLNLDVPEFAELNPTAENIARVIYEIMRHKLAPAVDIQVILYETPRNYVMYPA
ncbi:MAG: 6-pyruvoyl trahydropterin synthase family protein [Bacteroidia bacterium]